MSHRVCPVAIATMLALIVSARAGADYQPPDFIRAPAALPTDQGVERLSLRAALTESIANHLGVELSRFSVKLATLSRAAASGTFEPSLRARYDHFDSLSPPSTAQEGTSGSNLSLKLDNWSLGITHLLQTGATLALDFSNSRTRSVLGTAVDPLVYRSGLEFRVTQPLLRGFSLDLDIPRVEILRAEFDSERVVEEMRGQMMSTIEATETAYWRLVESIKNYQVEVDSARRAEQQLALTQRQIDSGLLPPASLIEAQSALAQRKLALVQADALIRQSSDVLARALGRRGVNSQRNIVPTDQPDFQQRSESIDQALATARANRPDVVVTEVAARRAELDARLADNDRLPNLDVSVGYGLVGQNDEYGNTVDNLFAGDSRSWSVGLNLSWAPLGFAARARQEAAKVRRQSAQTQLRNSLDDVELEVRTAIRDAQTAARALFAAAEVRELSGKSLEVEERKFVAGTSSNFLVAQRQDGLRNAQLGELRALVRHKVAITRLERATGTLLDARQIDVSRRK